MRSLLGRALTPEEQYFRDQLRCELAGLSRSVLRKAAARSPEQFFAAGFTMLESEMRRGERHRLYIELLECPEFLTQVANPDEFDRKQSVEMCRWLMDNVDELLDVRLAKLIPGRQEDQYNFEPKVVLRILDVLHVISPGPRLVHVIGHLSKHPNEQIASKATLFLGHRMRSEPWLRTHFQSSDARVRASVVEALWDVKTSYARQCFLDSLNDEDNRVVGNALFGLHLMGESMVHQRIESMLHDLRPDFRRTAVWLMGRIGNAEFAEALRQAQGDKDPGVRQKATQALCALGVQETAAAIQGTNILNGVPHLATE